MSIPGSASPLFLGAAVAEEAAFQIDRSVRLNSADSAYFSRTPSSAGNRRTFTYSVWVKRNNLGTRTALFGVGTAQNDSSYFAIEIESAGDLRVAGWNTLYAKTDALFRDPAAWYHLVIAVDTTQSAAADQIKIYKNGTLLTKATENAITQNTELPINSTSAHNIGYQPQANQYGDKMFANIEFIDGQALAPTDFGEYDDNNNWNPKAYDGTYGTNGFHLDFSDNSSNSALGEDSSGNNNDWTVNNLVAEQPRTFQSVEFDGSGDYLVVPNGSGVVFEEGSFTIECFVYARSYNSITYPTIISKYDNSDASWILRYKSDGDVVWYAGQVGGGTNNESTTQPITLNSWQHVAVVREGTGTNQTKVYFDGQLVLTCSDSSDYDDTNNIYIGRQDSSNANEFDGYISNVRIIKGTALYTSNFTSPTPPLTNVTNTKLLCCQSSSSATAATVSPGTITANGNASAIELSDSTSANDSLIDTPTNYEASSGNNGGNYPTFNPLSQQYSTAVHVLTNGNLQHGDGSSEKGNYSLDISTMAAPPSGKWYWEMTTDGNGTNERRMIAVMAADANFAQYIPHDNSTDGLVGIWLLTGQKIVNGSKSSYTSSFREGNVVGVALDQDGQAVNFYVNGTAQGSISLPSNMQGKSIVAAVSSIYEGENIIANFGQRPFTYTPPTNYKSLCTQNLPDPTIADGSTAFDAKLYTGNGSTQSITGLGFSPDWVWTAVRDSTGYIKYLWDTVRGSTKALASSHVQGDDAESTVSNGLTSFDSSGFSLGNNGQVNENNRSMVAWCWDAGTSTVSNTDGGTTANVRASAASGFSIVSWSGHGSGSTTIGHGLNAAPELIIIKGRNTTGAWAVGSDYLGWGNRLELHTAGASGEASADFNSTAPTSSVFTVGSNQGSGNKIAYCFAPVSQYSSVGVYSGNGSDDGPFVFTGFRPKFILTKAYSSNSNNNNNWNIYDTSRDPYNEASAVLSPNNNQTTLDNAHTGIDILSNGFKLKGDTNGQSNYNGWDYIYYAVAEHPFKTARAR